MWVNSAVLLVGEGYIRICYASKYEDIKEALNRMEKAFGTK